MNDGGWNQAYYEGWTALWLVVGLYAWGLVAGWVGPPW